LRQARLSRARLSPGDTLARFNIPPEVASTTRANARRQLLSLETTSAPNGTRFVKPACPMSAVLRDLAASVCGGQIAIILAKHRAIESAAR
jgi:hypothetical protein